MAGLESTGGKPLNPMPTLVDKNLESCNEWELRIGMNIEKKQLFKEKNKTTKPTQMDLGTKEKY